MRRLFLLFFFSLTLCSLPEKRWQMVLHARFANLTTSSLQLRDADQLVPLFTGNEIEQSHTLTLSMLVENWKSAFGDQAQEGILSYLDREGEYHRLELFLMPPRWEGNALAFDLELLLDQPPGAVGEVALFFTSISPDQEAKLHKSGRNGRSMHASPPPHPLEKEGPL